MLNVIDNQWKDHLLSMDHLKEGIGLRGYGQKDPLIEYKKESFTLFQDMMDRIEDETIKFLFFMRVEMGAPPPLPYPELVDESDDEDGDDSDAPERTAVTQTEQAKLEARQREAQQSVIDLTRNIQRKKDQELAQLQFNGNGTSSTPSQAKAAPKVGRNDLCPCGSGKKYKKCHGAG